MIKEISFDEIKNYWKILWLDMDVDNKIEYVSMPSCEYVEPVFIKLGKVSPYSIPSIFISYSLDNQIVGVLNGYKTSINYFRTRGLWVNPIYRKKGIATKLMNYIERFALNEGSKILWTIPRKTAINFYKNYGFEQMSDFTIYNGNNCFATKSINQGVKL